ncbi:hypothetical protein STEG23_015168, partial [Scotinomys teguina]
FIFLSLNPPIDTSSFTVLHPTGTFPYSHLCIASQVLGITIDIATPGQCMYFVCGKLTNCPAVFDTKPISLPHSLDLLSAYGAPLNTQGRQSTGNEKRPPNEILERTDYDIWLPEQVRVYKSILKEMNISMGSFKIQMVKTALIVI